MKKTIVGTLCPRCENNYYTPYGEEGRYPKPALSRTDNKTYICDPCGTEEALQDLSRETLARPDEWPVK